VWVGDGQVAVGVEGQRPAAFVDAVVVAVADRQQIVDIGATETTEPQQVMDVAISETAPRSRGSRIRVHHP